MYAFQLKNNQIFAVVDRKEDAPALLQKRLFISKEEAEELLKDSLEIEQEKSEREESCYEVQI